MMFREVSCFWLTGLTLLVVAGCGTSPRAPAPVETRGAPLPSVPVPAPEMVKVMPGYYKVQRGDTLTRIALDHGRSWLDLVTWNNLLLGPAQM